MRRARVLVAMSGGVDSSYAAYLLGKAGYEVIGATMKILPAEFCPRIDRKNCCSYLGVASARAVAHQLGIKFYVLDLAAEFRREVLDYFFEEYRSGRTPNPCIKCNEKIKFGALRKKADSLGCRLLATGHYARIRKNPRSGRWELRRGKDKHKDQSYVLFCLSQSKLSRTLFPLGDYRKKDVLANIRKQGLRVSQDTESQDICFGGDNDCCSLLREKLGVLAGKIVDTSGKVVGEHEGAYLFTIGQRRRLGISRGRRQYVVRIDSCSNTIVVGEEKDLFQKRLVASDLNWLAPEKPKFPLRVEAQIRYNHQPAGVLLSECGKGMVAVEFRKPQAAITPGQAVVFYRKDKVMGGGWIEKAGD